MERRHQILTRKLREKVLKVWWIEKYASFISSTLLFQKTKTKKMKGKIPILMAVTLRPQALRSKPILLAVTPLPRPLTTPPVTNTYFIFWIVWSFSIPSYIPHSPTLFNEKQNTATFSHNTGKWLLFFLVFSLLFSTLRAQTTEYVFAAKTWRVAKKQILKKQEGK